MPVSHLVVNQIIDEEKGSAAYLSRLAAEQQKELQRLDGGGSALGLGCLLGAAGCSALPSSCCSCRLPPTPGTRRGSASTYGRARVGASPTWPVAQERTALGKIICLLPHARNSNRPIHKEALFRRAILRAVSAGFQRPEKKFGLGALAPAQAVHQEAE